MFLRLLTTPRPSKPSKAAALSATNSIPNLVEAPASRPLIAASVHLTQLPGIPQRTYIKTAVSTASLLSPSIHLIDSPLAVAPLKTYSHSMLSMRIFSRCIATERPQVLNEKLITDLIADLKIKDLIAHDEDTKTMTPEEFETPMKLLGIVMKLMREMRYLQCKDIKFNKQLHCNLYNYVDYLDLPCHLDAIKMDFPNASEDFVNLMCCLEFSQETIMNYIEIAEPILHKEIFAKARLFSQQFFITFMTPDNSEDDLTKKNDDLDEPPVTKGMGSKS